MASPGWSRQIIKQAGQEWVLFAMWNGWGRVRVGCNPVKSKASCWFIVQRSVDEMSSSRPISLIEVDWTTGSLPTTQYFIKCKSKVLLWWAGQLLQYVQCTMCTLFSWLLCIKKLKSQKPLSHWQKLLLRFFFLCSFRMKTLKIVSVFIFRHWKHYFWNTQNREK